MGRRPRFTTDEILDAALAIAVADGPEAVTVTAVAAAVGAPSGSIYHRFAGRDELVARLWLRTITAFQAGLLDALRAAPEAVVDACHDHIFGWTAEHPDLARLMLLHDATDITARWPDTLAVELRETNDTARAAITELARRYFGPADRKQERENLDRMIYALIDLPYTAVRRHLPDGRPRPWLREFTTDAAHRVLGRPAT